MKKPPVLIPVFVILIVCLFHVALLQAQSNKAAAFDILINEVDLGIPDGVELFNAGIISVSLNGWKVKTGDSQRIQTFTLPDVTLEPGDYLVCYEGTDADTDSVIFLDTSDAGATNINWAGDSYGAVELLDTGDGSVDYVRWGDYSGMSVSTGFWSGPNVASPPATSNIGRDINSTDTNHGSDFIRQIGSLGRANDSPPIIEDYTLDSGVEGIPYADTIHVVGPAGPFTYTLVEGTLPGGLSIDNSGAVTGTASETGDFNFYLRVSDSQSPPQTAFAWMQFSVMTQPNFSKDLLLVNGVDWSTYSSEINAAYTAKAFWGNNTIDFWDNFDAPSRGYPSTLPAPLGHGAVPGSVLGDYKTIIWIGNNYNGDLGEWNDSPVFSYVKMGGNLVLMTRMTQDFINDEFSDYLGITWTQSEITLSSWTSVYSGLQSMSSTGTQNLNDAFSTSLSSGESVLLFQSGANGLGIWHKPAAGGTFNSDGGQVVLMCMRPYRVNTTQLRNNIEYILHDMMRVTAVDDQIFQQFSYSLSQNYPNPFNAGTLITYSLARPSHVKVDIYNVLGQKVRTMVNTIQPAGEFSCRWDGINASGSTLPSGVYYAQITAGEFSRTVKMTLVR
ncbi:lamin tail domain-containing protein [candidate division KSB1 bacterium]